MADQSIPGIRADTDARDDRGDRPRGAVEVPVRDAAADDGERGGLADAPAAPGVPEEPVETEAERVVRERREFIAAADDTEIVEGGRSTTAYRRANAVFDEADDRLQLAEFWTMRDESFDRFGRF